MRARMHHTRLTQGHQCAAAAAVMCILVDPGVWPAVMHLDGTSRLCECHSSSKPCCIGTDDQHLQLPWERPTPAAAVCRWVRVQVCLGHDYTVGPACWALCCCCCTAGPAGMQPGGTVAGRWEDVTSGRSGVHWPAPAYAGPGLLPRAVEQHFGRVMEGGSCLHLSAEIRGFASDVRQKPRERCADDTMPVCTHNLPFQGSATRNTQARPRSRASIEPTPPDANLAQVRVCCHLLVAFFTALYCLAGGPLAGSGCRAQALFAAAAVLLLKLCCCHVWCMQASHFSDLPPALLTRILHAVPQRQRLASCATVVQGLGSSSSSGDS